MASIMLVRDTANNKNVVLQVNGSNELGISASSLPLPTGAALESSLSSLNGKVTACNTGAVVVSSSALPSGASSASNQSIANTALQAIETAVEGTLAISASSLPLPSGAATSALQSAANTSLAGIDSKLGGTLVVSMGVVRSNGTITNNASVTVNEKSSSIDCNAAKEVAIYGNSSSNSQVIKVQVSDDDSTFYETDIYIYPNASAGDFYKKFDSCARYYRLHYEGSATMTTKYSMVN